MESSEENRPETPSASQNLVEHLQRRRGERPTEADHPEAPSTARNLVEHLQRWPGERPAEEDCPAAPSTARNLVEHHQRRHRERPTERGEPESESPTPLDPPPAHRAAHLRADWSTRQRHCSHPASMIKRFDDGVTYCRLCYACLTP